MKKLIIFDFDRTLTKRDTLRPFVKYIAASQKSNYKLFIFYLLLVQFKLKFIADKQFKEAFLRLFIKNMNVTEVQKIASSFLEDQLQYLLNDVIFEKLKNHIASGERVYLASANFDFFLYPLIKKWNLNGVISTETEKQDNCITGKIVGNTCKGEHKVTKIKVVLGEEALKTAVAYGDDEDSALLSSVAHAIKVSGDGLLPFDRFLKRSFDMTASLIGLMLTGWIILLAYILATIDTQKNGFFTQIRIGQAGKPFNVIKIRTMRDIATVNTNVTTKNDPRITKLGVFFRKTKIDELPQLINVFLGKMSFVGPRPDVSGFADKLCDKDKAILTVRPGITGPATLKYRNEEDLLSKQVDPEKYNQEVIFPDKTSLNREYVENYSFWKDMKYIWKTVFK